MILRVRHPKTLPTIIRGGTCHGTAVELIRLPLDENGSH